MNHSSTLRFVRPLGLIAATSAAALALPLMLDEMKTGYAKSTIYDVSITSETSSETTAFEALRDGEPMDRGGRGGGGGRSETLTVSYSDTILAAADGAPARVERSFDSVEGGGMREGRDDVMEYERTSAFDGITMVLTEGEDGVEVEVTDGDAPEEERLEGHALTLPLDGLLPTEDVAAGEEWEIEKDALLAAIGQGLSRKLLDRQEREGGGGRGEGRGGGGGRRGGRGEGGGQRPSAMNAGDWEITGTLTEETEDIDGVKAMVIKIAAELSGEMEQPERRRRDFAAGPMGATAAPLGITVSGEFEGLLYWSAEDNRPVKFTFEGSFETNTETVRESERGNFEMRSTLETSIDVTVEVGARTASDDD